MKSINNVISKLNIIIIGIEPKEIKKSKFNSFRFSKKLSDKDFKNSETDKLLVNLSKKTDKLLVNLSKKTDKLFVNLSKKTDKLLINFSKNKTISE